MEEVGVSPADTWGAGSVPSVETLGQGLDLGVLEERQDQDGQSSVRRKAGGEEFRKVTGPPCR